jgi:hypothetical protein
MLYWLHDTPEGPGCSDSLLWRQCLASMEHMEEEEAQRVIKRKFGYVVTCQIYGKMKSNQDPKADDIEMLLRRYPTLRVAYIDEEVLPGRDTSTFSSVLIRADPDGPGVQEIYRIRLPGNPVLGEGQAQPASTSIPPKLSWGYDRLIFPTAGGPLPGSRAGMLWLTGGGPGARCVWQASRRTRTMR